MKHRVLSFHFGLRLPILHCTAITILFVSLCFFLTACQSVHRETEFSPVPEQKIEVSSDAPSEESMVWNAQGWSVSQAEEPDWLDELTLEDFPTTKVDYYALENSLEDSFQQRLWLLDERNRDDDPVYLYGAGLLPESVLDKWQDGDGQLWLDDLETQGILLRRGSQWTYYHLDWSARSNLGAPMLLLEDLNGDEKPEILVILASQYWLREQLYLFDYDTLEPITLDYNALPLTYFVDSESDELTISAGSQQVVLSLADVDGQSRSLGDISLGNRVELVTSHELRALRVSVSFKSDETMFQDLMYITFPLEYEDQGYQLGEPSFVTDELKWYRGSQDFPPVIRFLFTKDGELLEAESRDRLGLLTLPDEHYDFSEIIQVSNGRELTLRYTAQKLDEYDTYGINQVEVWEDEQLIQTISVCDDLLAGDFEFGADFLTYGQYTDCWNTESLLTVSDMNFDGAEDFGLFAWITTGANIPYYYWLWDEDSGQFCYSFCLSNARPDPDTCQIICDTRDGYGCYSTTFYRFTSFGVLEPVMWIEDRFSDDENLGSVIITTTYEWQDGTWIQTEQQIEAANGTV